jgi:ArsR family transcriptional regulator, arsenate/arsenite/antimonite-responsive transcriptional repressor
VSRARASRKRRGRSRELLLKHERMDLVSIYECLCDLTRLRILHLLTQTPLCVCHFQKILQEPQVKVSKHLAYLRRRGMVETRQEKNWVIYSLPSKRSRELEANLKCLQDCAQTDRVFTGDLKRLEAVRSKRDEPSVAVACCGSAERKAR